MSTFHLQIIAGLALMIVLVLVFAAIAGRLNDRRAVDRSEMDIWNVR